MIEIKNVTKIYNGGKAGEVKALDDVSLTIEDGEFVAVTGESGSGKSTLLNLIGALDAPTQGKIYVGGQDISGFSEEQAAKFRRENVGFVFQGFYLEESFSVLVNVEIPLILRGADEKEREARAREMLEKFDLADKAEAMPAQLSGGQMQRVCIARALAGGAKLILADEPTGNLDSVSGSAVIDVFRKLAEEGVTIVMVTHNKEFAARCDRIIELKDGRVQ